MLTPVERSKTAVRMLDQRKLPLVETWLDLETPEEVAGAITDMVVRGAPAIGISAAFGLALGATQAAADPEVDLDLRFEEICAFMNEARPTAVNLRWALEEMAREVGPLSERERADAAWTSAAKICDDDVEICRRIGEYGLLELQKIASRKGGESVNILTHCNAGWLATVDWGTALAPVYLAHDSGMAVHVWVDETRPRNQGAALTAYELASHGVQHTLIADNAGGHLMQHGMVDVCLVGTDRTTAAGDVANKIGTYLKALAARDNEVPFFVCLPSPTVDWTVRDGVAEIPIEERPPEELTWVHGRTSGGNVISVEISPAGCPAGNWAFDVTPARLVTGLITERGLCDASAEGLATLFPEHVR